MLTWRLDEMPTPGGRTSPVVLYSGDEGRVILVGLEPGQELGEHEVREHAWLLPIAGSVDVEANGTRIEIEPGVLVRFEAGERHAVRSPGGSRLLLILMPWPGPGHYGPGEQQA